MYPVSDKFMEAVQKNTRTFYWTGSIVTKNHQTYPFGNEDIVKGSGYITRQCCGSTEIELGTVYASEMGISLYSDVDRYTLDGAEIRLSFHLVYEDGAEEEVPMGVFEVSEANRAVRCLELKAYDYMLRFDKSLQLNSSSGTAYNFLSTACNDCHVELAQSKEELEQLPNGKEILGIYADNDMETYRDLLFYTAQVLGCFCRINREGQLELVPYGSASVMNIPSTQRFDSTYSDFITRYTAVSSTNIRSNIAEYYALEKDDGLTMNLGINPLLQYGLKATRERMLTAILNAVSVIDYVPFESTTIGNPALDPGDILTFSGGHADDSKISCITSITYKVNGKHSLKCVGKNPRLSAAKSKNDKNITGLINQVESGKTVVYNFVNAAEIDIGDVHTEILSIDFTAKEETSAHFLAEILLSVATEDTVRTVDGTANYEDTTDGKNAVTKPVHYTFTEKGQAELEVVYRINNEDLEYFIPTKTCINGNHILTLFLPLTRVAPNSANNLTVLMKIAGGTAHIGASQIKATISGQGLVAGLGEWNGKLTAEETIELYPLRFYPTAPIAMVDGCMVSTDEPTSKNLSATISLLPLRKRSIKIRGIREKLSVEQIVEGWTFTTAVDSTYATDWVITDGGVFALRHDFSAVSIMQEIDQGLCAALSVDTTIFKSVEGIEVKY